QDMHHLVVGEARALDALAQSLSLDVWHAVPGQSGDVACRDHGDDVRLLKTGGEPDLTLESLDGQAGRELGRQYLYEHAAGKAPLFRDQPPRHPPAAELTLYGIARAEGGLELVAKVRHRWAGVIRGWLPALTLSYRPLRQDWQSRCFAARRGKVANVSSRR